MRLITAKEIYQAKKENKPIYIDKDTIVTPLARDIAKENNVSFEDGSSCKKEKVEVVETKECALSEDEIYNILKLGIENKFFTEKDLENLLGKEDEKKTSLNIIPVGISGRHVHLSKEHLEILFGKDYELTPIKNLTQPGQFASKETVTLAGPKSVIENVRIIGPVRSKTQVEILTSDAFKLGLKPVVRLSGHLEGTPGITIIGKKGTVVLDEGVIVSQRHIHLNEEQGRERNLKNGDVVKLRTRGIRSAILDNVSVRVGDNGYLDCHLDQEEANALGLNSKSYVEIVR
ncbi:phosphate propanoyltransferase [Peptoniphilus porci]|uniref:phosphate propanoyltransferase n=1 Tax=Peptoniphilus porci TaxID=2652280 RepID=UPI0009FB1FB7|nr:phosphate propanoyltransferase [Peptoniphilus porci]